jgi:DNA repair photolyase
MPSGRGAPHNPKNRYLPTVTLPVDDGWGSLDAPPPPLVTSVTRELSKTILSHNDSPDVGFGTSLNPYKGCEHGCIYCFARPTHAYLDLSPGLDFESRLFSKPDAPRLLRETFRKKNYRPGFILLGANTDAYQPIERELRITRQLLEVFLEFRHPVGLLTKSSLILRDLDLITALAGHDLVSATISVTTLDRSLARVMEPRAATPERRLDAIRHLAFAGVPVSALAAPMIPALNEPELERILEAVAAAGARSTGYVLVRLPLEIKELFEAWLDEHFPLKKDHILSLIRDARGGELYDSTFGVRMKGTGAYAELLRARFGVAARRLGLDDPMPELDTAKFRVPPAPGDQHGLFDRPPRG